MPTRDVGFAGGADSGMRGEPHEARGREMGLVQDVGAASGPGGDGAAGEAVELKPIRAAGPYVVRRGACNHGGVVRAVLQPRP